MGASSTKLNVLIVGLSGTGKTTILYNWKLSTVQKNFTPTDGYNHEVIEQFYLRKRYELYAWDLAGKEELISVWQHFYEAMDVDVLCFVINAHDTMRLPSAKKEFMRLVNETALRKAIKIIVANQFSDSEFPKMTPAAIKEGMGVGSILHETIDVITVNAYTGDGFDELNTCICKRAGASSVA